MAHFEAYSVAIALALFAAILACMEIGRRLGKLHQARDPDSARAGAGAIEGAVFGLMGLLVAFTFSGAMHRWDVRRLLVVEESNDIGTAWLRIELLPSEARPALRDLLRHYLDERIAVYQVLPDVAAARERLARSERLQGEIWSYAAAACVAPGGEPARILLLPALNAMIDVTSVRTTALLTHPPFVVFALLAALLLASALIAGYATTPAPVRSWMHMLCFAIAMSISVYVILDLEYPRAGLFRLDETQAMVDLRASMK